MLLLILAGIVTFQACLSLKDCRNISCSAARTASDCPLVFPATASMIKIGQECNRTCCDQNKTCVEITSLFATTPFPNGTA